jgi:tetratricopeptide (TPR) repeat protein
MTPHDLQSPDQSGHPSEPAGGNEPPSGRNELTGSVQGSVVQAGHIYGGVHVQAVRPASLPPPAQLPPPPANFTGRDQELAILDEHAMTQDPGRVMLLVITGAGGVGKSALALHWLHRVSGRYPAGALYADLSGHMPGATRRPGEVLTGFLRALDVPAEQIPLSLSEQAALFRSVTSRRRLLMLLDNPVSAGQVRALLPGSPPGPELEAAAAQASAAGPRLGEGASLVVVTTRRRITGLAIDGARFVDVGPLGEDAAVELLARTVGADRAAREPEAVRRVVRMCSHLPIAVCVCAARLVPRPRWGISRIADELASERDRLATLSLAGDVSVRAVFDLSYRALAKQTARTYRLTSLLPGPDFSPDLVAAAIGMDLRHTGRLLEDLADASLLEETAEQRYRFHDLIRLHAREHAGGHPAQERQAVITRGVTWYLRQAVAADEVIMPYRWRLNPMYQHDSGSPAYPGPAAALDAQEASLPGVLAATRAASEQELHELAWQLCEAMWGLFMHRKLVRPWISSHLIGLASARACGNRRAQARMSVQLGAAYLATGRRDDARHLFSEALELERQEDHQIGIATALEQLGRSELADGHPEEAIGCFTEARGIFTEIGRPRAVALMARCTGDALIVAGRPSQAIDELLEASAQFAALPDPFMHARACTVLGKAYLAAGQPHQAAVALESALDTMTELGIPYEQGRIYDVLAQTARQLGDHDKERACQDRAQAAYKQANTSTAGTR